MTTSQHWKWKAPESLEDGLILQTKLKVEIADIDAQLFSRKQLDGTYDDDDAEWAFKAKAARSWRQRQLFLLNDWLKKENIKKHNVKKSPNVLRVVKMAFGLLIDDVMEESVPDFATRGEIASFYLGLAEQVFSKEPESTDADR